MVRFFVHDGQIIKIEGHIGLVVFFVAHPDVMSSHGRYKDKGCQGI